MRECVISSRWMGVVGALALVVTATADANEATDPFDKKAPATASPASAKILRYARRVIARYDADGDGQLQAAEWKSMRGQPAGIDADQDGVISFEEYAGYVSAYGVYRRILLASPAGPSTAETQIPGGDEYESEPDTDSVESLRRSKKFYVPNSRLPKGLSQEFFNRDIDGDGQLTLAEFAPKATAAEVERFKKLDANLDGVVTAREYARGPKAEPAPSSEPPAP